MISTLYLPINDFLKKSQNHVIIDVRSEKEYQQGHIPGSISLPLFNNEERHQVGLTYKKKGKIDAIKLGLEMVGSKLTIFYETALKFQNKKIFIYCWRGGLRSRSVAYYLYSLGFSVFALSSGYKSFRRFVLNKLEENYNFIVLGGYTGSNKTKMIQKLKNKIPCIDLESLANHKGSAFGGFPSSLQPSNEHFENQLAIELSKYNNEDFILLEDESKMIGKIFLPVSFRKQMRNSPVIFLDIPRNQRVENLIDDYQDLNKNLLLENVRKIKSKIGLKKLNEIERNIELHNYQLVAEDLLEYYDKTYLYGLKQRDQQFIHKVDYSKTETSSLGEKILFEYYKIKEQNGKNKINPI